MMKRINRWACGILGAITFAVCLHQSADIILTSSAHAPAVNLACGYERDTFINPCADLNPVTIEDRR